MLTTSVFPQPAQISAFRPYFRQLLTPSVTSEAAITEGSVAELIDHSGVTSLLPSPTEKSIPNITALFAAQSALFEQLSTAPLSTPPFVTSSLPPAASTTSSSSTTSVLPSTPAVSTPMPSFATTPPTNTAAVVVTSSASPANSPLSPPHTSAINICGKAKRKRTTFTPAQAAVLEREYSTDMYMPRSRRLVVAETLNLSENQIKTWFQNRRAKEKKTKYYGNSGIGRSSTSPPVTSICLFSKTSNEAATGSMQSATQQSASGVAVSNRLPISITISGLESYMSSCPTTTTATSSNLTAASVSPCSSGTGGTGSSVSSARSSVATPPALLSKQHFFPFSDPNQPFHISQPINTESVNTLSLSQPSIHNNPNLFLLHHIDPSFLESLMNAGNLSTSLAS